MRTPGIRTESSTVAPSATCTSGESTELRTVPWMMQPVDTIDSAAVPDSTNLAGGSCGGLVRIGHCRL